MQKKGNIRQLGAKLGTWIRHGLKALQFTTKSGRKTKKVATSLGLSLMPTKFKDSATKAGRSTSFGCASTSSAIGCISLPPTPITLLPAGKMGKIVQLMSSNGSASLDDLMVATGWQRHTVRAALSRLRQREFVITASQRNGQTIYTLQRG